MNPEAWMPWRRRNIESTLKIHILWVWSCSCGAMPERLVWLKKICDAKQKSGLMPPLVVDSPILANFLLLL
jgi:hypothetical protein